MDRILAVHEPADLPESPTYAHGRRRGPHFSPPRDAAESADALPPVGSVFVGFRLLAELGSGAFGRVYFAEQSALADRPVALKVAPDVGVESRALAQLQHTHIVPIYSTHRAGNLQAVCMPYFGSATLADVLAQLRQAPALPQRGVDLLAVLRERPGRLGQPLPRAPGSLANVHERLRGLSYVEAVLWLGACLADGLAHAHERGILHRDLKPGNVLLDDDGMPMLLDFNLAEDTKAGAAILGGTLPYMAPEQLAAFAGEACGVDGRSDLYALGVVLYELLTTRFPFASGRQPEVDRSDPYAVQALLCRMIDERAAIPRLRDVNPQVTPAVEAILRRCLDPSPARRYPSARHLQEDLQRQLQHLPLRHTREVSMQERARKWIRRHPRLGMQLTGLVALVLLGLVLALGVRVHQEGRRRQALACREAFADQVRLVQFLLHTRPDSPKQQNEGRGRCLEALARYGVLEDGRWLERPAVAALAEEERQELEGEVGELLYLLARTALRPAPGRKVGPADLREALGWNKRAERCFAPDEVPSAIWQQRAELHRRLGEPIAAANWEEQARSAAPRTARDHYLAAHHAMTRGDYRSAQPLLEKATRLDSRSFWAWFLFGICYDGMSQDPRAVNAYTVAIALAPNFPGAHVNRGLTFLRQKEYQRAVADFDKVIELDPTLPETYLDRAIAYQGLRQHRRALADLSEAIDRGIAATRVYFLRSRVRKLMGDTEGAKHDFATGLQLRPADELSWVSRGLARLQKDSAGALADFAEALALNPGCRQALQNQAHVLSERLGKTAEAIAVLDRLLATYPDYVAGRAGRAVLHARLGKREAALADAAESLRLDQSPGTLYQVACAYALTSRQNPNDAETALRHLREALARNYGRELLGEDEDLAPLRKHLEFARLRSAAATLRTEGH